MRQKRERETLGTAIATQNGGDWATPNPLGENGGLRGQQERQNTREEGATALGENKSDKRVRSAGGVSWGDSKSDKRVRICGEASVGDKNTSDNLGRRELLLSGRAIATRCLPELPA